MISARMPDGCKEPDDELKQIVGRSYAAIFQLALGIMNRCDLAGANIDALVEAAGGVDFYALINAWVTEAQRMELEDSMLSVFDSNEDIKSLFGIIGVTSPVDLLDQTSAIWRGLLRTRCGVTNVELVDIDRWKKGCVELVSKHRWVGKWRCSTLHDHQDEMTVVGEGGGDISEVDIEK